MTTKQVVCPKAETCPFQPKDLNPHCRPHEHDVTCDKREPICPVCIQIQEGKHE